MDFFLRLDIVYRPIIPPNWEVGIRKPVVPGQPMQKIRETPSQPKGWT
jgi:hypothetical protein